MKKLGILIMAMVLVCGMSFGVMAEFEFDNPWVNDGDRVNVNLQVGQWGEVYSAIGSDQARDTGNYENPIVLEVDNAGGIIPQEGIAEDTINHYANVGYNVSVSIDGDIPNYSRFHVIVNPSNRGDYDEINADDMGTTTVDAEKVITWEKRDGGEYSLNGYGDNSPGDTILAFSDTSSLTANETKVDYAMSANMGIPTEGTNDIDVIWTIAAQ